MLSTQIRRATEEYQQVLIVATGLILLLILQNVIQETISRLIFLYLFVAIAYRVDARLPVAAAVLLLLGAAVAVASNEGFANNLATYGYYFLVIGVVMQLIEYLRGGETGEGLQQEERIQQVMKMKSNLHTEGEKHRIIAIASGKGGVGKTTVAANLGTALAKLGNKVTIIDMDLAMPNLEIITGLRSPPVGLIDVLEGKLGLERVIYTGPMGTKVIPPGVMLDGYSNGNTEKIRELLIELPLKNDYVILDMPPGREAVDVLWNDMEALIVMNPDKASVLDGLNMKVLLEKKGVKVLGAVLNRADHDERWIDEIERMLEVSVVAVIPDSRTVKRALENEECFVIAEEESAPSREIMGLANEIES